MISVVIPAFNEEILIRECLESLKKQDFTGKYEIVVVDNASEDSTAQVAREMGVRVVNCPKKGVSYARQAGAEAAKGEIIVQADADTVYPRWWLTRLQKQFSSHPEAIAVAGTFLYKNPPWWAYFEYFLRAFWNLFTVLFYKRPFIISGANFAFYKKSLMQIGGYDPDTYSSDQFNISTRLSALGKVVFDRRSWCATSNRSVAKPLMTIIAAFIVNVTTFFGHWLKLPLNFLKKRAKKISSASPGTYILIGILIILIAILSYGYYVPASPVFGKVYAGVATPDKVIALTFDDGPNDPYTSQLLDLLSANNVQATFFLVGLNVKANPGTTKRILEEENVIGNHSYSHNANHAIGFSGAKDAALAQQAIFEVAGVEPHLYRAPHGKKSPWELEGIKNLGLIEIMWNISTNELSGKSPEFLANQIVLKARPGGIIDLHDGYGTLNGTGRANKRATVEIASIVIQRLKAEGYTFVTIPQLLEVPAYSKVAE